MILHTGVSCQEIRRKMTKQEKRQLIIEKMKLSFQMLYPLDRQADCYECFVKGIEYGEQLQREYGKGREFYELVRDYFEGKNDGREIKEWIQRTEQALKKMDSTRNRAAKGAEGTKAT